MEYPDNMDLECIPICEALNALPGVQTTESCCGHGQYRFTVFFSCTSFETLKRIARAIESSSWHVEAVYHNGSETLGFVLEGAVGHPEYTEHLVAELTD